MDAPDYPEVRDVATVLRAMESVSRRCATETDRDVVAALFHESLSLMLELRVPRMPDTDEELADMLRGDPDDGPALSSDEVFERLQEHGRAFSSFLDGYRRLVAEARWPEAAGRLMPQDAGEGVRWRGGPYALTLSGDGRTARVSDARRTVTGVGALDGTAALAAVMEAHLAWRDAWWR